jgi:hypothetical protein
VIQVTKYSLSYGSHVENWIFSFFLYGSNFTTTYVISDA